MSDEASSGDEKPVTFNVKSSSDAKYVLTVPLSMTVVDLKSKLSTSEYADIAPERQRLIYSGRVLKDPDTLSSYKIKEGNTVHLVKGAASNQRQNPAASNPAPTSTGAQPAAGVPTNLAAGTGRDPLAGLTGARYAGYAQMPNANMFGADGGMGAPPDPEQMASMLENPNFASTLNEALSNPDVIDQMIRSNPMLRDMGPQVRQMMQDPGFRQMMTDPNALRNISQMQRQFGGGMGGMFGGMGGGGGNQAFPAPGVTDTTEGAESTATPEQRDNTPQAPPNPLAMFGNPGAASGGGAGAASGNPFAALFGPAAGGPNPQANVGTGSTQGPGAEGAQQQSQQQQPANPFLSMAQNMMRNPQMMQQMMAAMGGGGGGLPGSQNPSNPSDRNAPAAGNPGFDFMANMRAMQELMGSGQSDAPRDDRPPEERYAEQLRQLNDMGFYEFERNVEALRRTGGSVQGAVEYLLTH